jgi:hypothetical protein
MCLCLYKFANDSTFDHCGVVVMDELGSPYILERSSSGFICTPYASRILNSTSKQIVLMPMDRPGNDGMEFRKKSFAYAKQITAESSDCELTDLMLGSMAKLIKSYSGNSAILRYPFSPSIKCVLDAMSRWGVQFGSQNIPIDEATVDDLADRKIFPVENKYQLTKRIVIRGM